MSRTARWWPTVRFASAMASVMTRSSSGSLTVACWFQVATSCTAIAARKRPATSARARASRTSAPVPGRIWYSTWTDNANQIGGVVLAKLEPTMTTVATLAAQVVHVTSGSDGGAAVLTLDGEIIVLDPDGRERRRIRIPIKIADGVGNGIVMVGEGFVALTPTTVLLDLGARGVFGWSLATGAPLS
jgi:hypothetical protein